MGIVDGMRARLARATELGVASRDFLDSELAASRAWKDHLNSRVAQAGREGEAAVRELEHELDTPGEAMSRLAARQAMGDYGP